MMPKLRLLIGGKRIQEVGLRSKLIALAMELGIDRFLAHNLENGSVSVLIDANEEKLKAFKKLWRERMPKQARISEVVEEPFDGEVPSIYNTILAFEFEHWNRAIPVLVEIRNGVKELGGKIDKVAEKVDMVGKKVDETREELKAEVRAARQDFRAYLDREIGEIKARLSRLEESVLRKA